MKIVREPQALLGMLEGGKFVGKVQNEPTLQNAVAVVELPKHERMIALPSIRTTSAQQLLPGDAVLIMRPYGGATPAIYLGPWYLREEWAELRSFPNGRSYPMTLVRPMSDLVFDTPFARAVLRRAIARIDAALDQIASAQSQIAGLSRCKPETVTANDDPCLDTSAAQR